MLNIFNNFDTFDAVLCDLGLFLYDMLAFLNL